MNFIESGGASGFFVSRWIIRSGRLRRWIHEWMDYQKWRRP